MMITSQLLISATGCGPYKLDLVAAALSHAMDVYGIDTSLRQAHFLAQIAFESGGFKSVEENLNYRPDRLLAVFPKYFGPGRADPAVYAGNPEMLANLIYASRLGNGDTASGDGARFRGRGYIQLTGRANYAAFQAKHPECPCVTVPDALCTPEFAALSAACFWDAHGINAMADRDDVAGVSARINGGDPVRPYQTINGFSGRVAATSRAKSALGA